MNTTTLFVMYPLFPLAGIGTESSYQIQQRPLDIEQLKKECNLTDMLLKRVITDCELYHIADLFGCWSEYVDSPGLELTQGEKAQIRNDTTLTSNVLRMKEALKIWKWRNPLTATFLNLLNVLLALKTQGEVALNLCKHLCTKL